MTPALQPSEGARLEALDALREAGALLLQDLVAGTGDGAHTADVYMRISCAVRRTAILSRHLSASRAPGP